MTGLAMKGLRNDPQLERCGIRVADELRRYGLSVKEIAQQVLWRTGHPIDVRTVENAMRGSLSLDTYDVFVGAFGWDFSRAVMAPRVGKTPLQALEEEIQRDRTALAAREAQFERRLAAERARVAAPGGSLRLLAETDLGPPDHSLGRGHPDLGD